MSNCFFTRGLVAMFCFLLLVSSQLEIESHFYGPTQPQCLQSNSQDKEEDALRDAFGWQNKLTGTYVEIGALDGSKFSNTVSLATCQNWGGVLVEGSRINYDALLGYVQTQQRPNLTAFYGAVCSPHHKTLRFIEGGSEGAVGGGQDAMSESFKNLWHPKHNDPRFRTVKVPCKPMEYYLRSLKHVDFFSLDVEGSELIVLETIDFKAVTIDVFMIEFDEHDLDKNWKIEMMMSNLGYSECETLKVFRSKVYVRDSAKLNC